MNKVFTIANREFKAAVMTKAFLIGIIVMPIMMGGSLLIQYVFRDSKSTEEKTFYVIDRTPGGTVFKDFQKAVDERNAEAVDPVTKIQKEPKFKLVRENPTSSTPDGILKQRFDLAEKVRNRTIFGYLDIGAKVMEKPPLTEKESEQSQSASIGLQSGSGRGSRIREGIQFPPEYTIRYYSNSPTYGEFHNWAMQELNKIIIRQRAETGKITKEQINNMITLVNLYHKELPRINKITGEIEDGKDVNLIVSFLIPFGIVIVMFMVIMVGATPLMQGVVEEKMQRISEVLLASAQPFQLMLGKLLGGVAVSMLLGSVYVIGALYGAWQYGFGEYLTPMVVFWFLLYLALAVLMFGSLFIAVGAACTDIKETQSLLMPVMLLATFPMFFLTKVIQEPDGTIATALSFFPFATPSIMVCRTAIPPGAPGWQPVAGIFVVLATTILCVWVASRIFRVGLLMQGKGASMGEIIKWVWKG